MQNVMTQLFNTNALSFVIIIISSLILVYGTAKFFALFDPAPVFGLRGMIGMLSGFFGFCYWYLIHMTYVPSMLLILVSILFISLYDALTVKTRVAMVILLGSILGNAEVSFVGISQGIFLKLLILTGNENILHFAEPGIALVYLLIICLLLRFNETVTFHTLPYAEQYLLAIGSMSITICSIAIFSTTKFSFPYVQMWVQSVIFMLSLMAYFLWFYRRQLKRANIALHHASHSIDILTSKTLQQDSNQEKMAKEWHDFKKHYSMINQLLSEGKSQEAQLYMEEIGERLTQVSDVKVYTGNVFIDRVLNMKREEAMQADIPINIRAFGTMPPAGHAAISLALNNILENALEASHGIDKATIDVQIICKAGVIHITTKNYFVPGREKKDRATNKGYGLKIIEEIAQEQHGACRIQELDDVFQVDFFADINPS